MPMSKRYKAKPRPKAMVKRPHKRTMRSPMAPYGYKQPIGRTELKYLDIPLDDGTVGLFNGDGTGTAGQVLCNQTGNTVSRCLLNGIAQGTDATQRIGRKFICKKLHGKINIQFKDNQFQAQTIRLVLVYDKCTNSASQIPPYSSVFVTEAPWGMVNLNFRDRFVIIWDKIFDVGDRVAGAATGYLPSTSGFPGVGSKHITFTKRINLETINSGTGATVGSIASGGLYLYAISCSAGDSTKGFSCRGVIRLRYADP